MADETNNRGRPLKFESAESLQAKIDAYFKDCDRKKKPYTITGLALALDTSRKVLLEYEQRDDEYRNTIKKAKLKIENYAEESLFTSRNTAGVIFNLVNNYAWSNKQELSGGFNNTNHNTNQEITLLSPEERRARIDELNRRRGNGASAAP